MTSRPYLSIVIANYNKAEYLPALLPSIVDNGFADYEIIFVDDASTDGSAEAAGAYPVRLIRNPVNRGPAYCRNLGAREARGEVLLFCDSDAAVGPDALKTLAGHFRTKDIAALTGNPALPPLKRNWIGYFSILEWQEYVRLIGFEQGRVGVWGTVFGAVRSDLFRSLGGFHEGFRSADIEDIELSFRFPDSAAIYFDKAITFRHSYESLALALRKAARRAFLLGNWALPARKSDQYLASSHRLAGYALSLAVVGSAALAFRSPWFVLACALAVPAKAFHSRALLVEAHRALGPAFAAYCFAVKLILPLPVIAGFASGRALGLLGWRAA